MWRRQLRRALKNSFSETSSGKKISQREFARRVGISSGAVSEIISGKRALSVEVARRLLNIIELPEAEKNDISARVESSAKSQRELLAQDAYEMISKWYFVPLLFLGELENPPHTAEEIAKRLGIPEKEAQYAIDRLLHFGLLEKTSTGDLKYPGRYWTTTDNIKTEALRRAHQDDLRLAVRALDKIPVENRDFTTVTFSGSTKKMDLVRSEIRRFRDRMVQLMDDTEVDQVFKLGIQLYPIDRWGLGEE